MARKLPWLSKAPAKAAHSPQAKRQKLVHPTPDSESDSHAPPKPKRNPPQAANRTPSSSPPPFPPSQHRMRPGLHADDICIMVEDEFLATAQLYTKHLHHAEYQRLKALSRTRNTDINISRPVCSPAMRDETRRKKDADVRAKRIDAGLDPLLATKKLAKAAEEVDEESEFEIEKNDPWQGTQLQRFMTRSPRKERGLMGLQGVVSTTRAAAGYSAPDRAGTRGAPSKISPWSKTPPKELLDEHTTSDEEDDEDDLDAPVARASSRPHLTPRATAPQTPTSPTPQRSVTKPCGPLGNSILHSSKTNRNTPPNISKPSKTPPKRSFLDMSPLPAAAVKQSLSSPIRSIKKEPQPCIKPGHSQPAAPLPKSDLLRQRLKAKRERDERERRKGIGAGVTGVDEIPVFLV